MVVAAQVADVVRPRAAQVERLCAGHQHARNEVHLFGRIEVDMSPFGVFEHGRAVTQAVGFEIVVGRKHRHVLPVARLAFEAVLAQASVDVFQRPGFHARPEHLQDFSVRGVVIYDGIAGPVAVVLVDFAFLDLGIGEGGFRMADVGAGLVVAFARGVVRLHVVGQPYQVVVALLSGGDRRPFLDHQAVAREAATAPGAGLAVHHAVETVVERPEDMAAGQCRGEHAVAAVPAQRTGEEGIVFLVLVDEDAGILPSLVGHLYQIPRRVDGGRNGGRGNFRRLVVGDRRVVEVVARGQGARTQAEYAECYDISFHGSLR